MNADSQGNWTTPEDLTQISAEELARALILHHIGAKHVEADEDGVTVWFVGIFDAGVMLTLAVEGTGELGSLHDRATAGCLSLSSMGVDASEQAVCDVIDGSWVWVVHPHIDGRVVGWHVSVTMSADDANQVTASLNTLHHGGAL